MASSRDADSWERAMNESAILVLNAGSSSLKVSVFRVLGVVEGLQLRGQVSGIGTAPHFEFRHSDRELLEERSFAAGAIDHRTAVDLVLEACGRHLLPGQRIAACGHRVVHGGTRYAQPVRIAPNVIGELE